MSGNTNFLYDGQNVIQELSGTTPTANLLTGGLDERFMRAEASSSAFYATDALGSTVALIDASGAEKVQYTYDPFGDMSVTGTTDNSYTFTGRESDGLDIYYYRARYYNPTLGRFLSEDPIGFTSGSTDLYAYVGDDPTFLTDPSGKCPWCVGVGVGAVIGRIYGG